MKPFIGLPLGYDLSDGPTRPCVVRRLRDAASSTFLEITITEGRNRQVRRMIEAIGSRVRKLVRIRSDRVDRRSCNRQLSQTDSGGGAEP